MQETKGMSNDQTMVLKPALDEVVKISVNRGTLGMPVSERTVNIEFGHWTHGLAVEMHSLVPPHRRRGLEIEKIEEYINWLLDIRCLQCNKLVSTAERNSVQVITIFLPMLASFGRFEDTSAKLTIRPVRKVDGLEITREGLEEKLAQMNGLAMDLASYGFHLSLGLPHDETVEDTQIYQIEQTSDFLNYPKQNIVVLRPEVVVTRMIVKMEYLADLFGSARTTYLDLSEGRAVIVKLALIANPKESNNRR